MTELECTLLAAGGPLASLCLADLFHLFWLVTALSLVWTATRHERMRFILDHAWRFGGKTLAVLAVVGVVVAFVFSSVSKWATPMTALNMSVALRLAYHLYQGPVGVVSIVPMGLILGFAYMRWKRLWPLVIAHGLMDFVALAAL